MCDTCGCGNTNETRIYIPGEDDKTETDEQKHNHAEGHDHSHDHSHHHNHSHDHGNTHDHSHKKIDIETDILEANNLVAERNRGYFEAKGNFVLNMMSSPGSGKTTLLERTIKGLKGDIIFYVVEGDQQTDNDANKIISSGAKAIQVNTGNGCHLDAQMINRAVKQLQPVDNSIMVIENVGNLVCPSLFDLGENKRVVIISVTEGDDKPLKYPTIFETADLCIVNKTDLLPYVDFDIEKVKKAGLTVNHHLEFIELSAKTGDGINNWFCWLRDQKGN